jgi:hypothetical protein
LISVRRGGCAAADGKGNAMKAPSRNAGFICLLLFIVGVIGFFVPLGGIPFAGPVLQILNEIDVYILMVGYGLLLLTVYIF